MDDGTAAVLLFGALVSFVGVLWLLDWIGRRRDRQAEQKRA